MIYLYRKNYILRDYSLGENKQYKDSMFKKLF